MGLVVHTGGGVDFEVWNSEIPCFTDILIADIGFFGFSSLSSFYSPKQCVQVSGSSNSYRNWISKVVVVADSSVAVESASLLTEKTAILQLIGSNNKEKQPALAPREYSNMQTPISLNVTNNTPPINRIMTYQNITKLKKFSGKENNTYSWIVDTKKTIIANSWDNDHTIQTLLFFLTRTANS
ncbi:hypothetical protein G9A89_008846 [Geosiphon pyriformis]|nr:hypothetical protein G9A89_008846 [Geosiphon pyriformis]